MSDELYLTVKQTKELKTFGSLGEHFAYKLNSIRGKKPRDLVFGQHKIEYEAALVYWTLQLSELNFLPQEPEHARERRISMAHTNIKIIFQDLKEAHH